MVLIFSCYLSGAILLRTKATCWKRMRRFFSISVNLHKRYISYTLIHELLTRTLSAFLCGRTQHVRRIRSSIVSLIQSVSKFMRAIPHSRLTGHGSLSFWRKKRFCDGVSFGIIPGPVQKCRVLFSNYFVSAMS